MRCVKAKNERFTELLAGSGICFIASRMPQACRSQINGRVFSKILRFFVVLLAVSLFSRPLVFTSLAVNDVTFVLNLYYSFNALTTSKTLYRAGSVSHQQVVDYFGNSQDLTFMITDAKYDRYEVKRGSADVSLDNPNSIVTSLELSWVNAAGTRVYKTVKLNESVTLSYGGSGFSITAYPAIGTASSNVSGSYLYTYTDFTFVVPASALSDNEALNDINDKLQDHLDQDKQYHDEEQQQGEDSGSDASQMVQDLTDQVKSKWEILFYPIEFTQKFLGLFTSSADGSTVISFPSFSIMGMTVWDSYDFDLVTVKNQFSDLFDLLYMVIGVIEVMWFLKYLYCKYDEVFGGQ